MTFDWTPRRRWGIFPICGAGLFLVLFGCAQNSENNTLVVNESLPAQTKTLLESKTCEFYADLKTGKYAQANDMLEPDVIPDASVSAIAQKMRAEYSPILGSSQPVFDSEESRQKGKNVVIRLHFMAANGLPYYQNIEFHHAGNLWRICLLTTPQKPVKVNGTGSGGEVKS